ncbi:YfhO family protein [Lysinibacillus sp. KU-BSD001]|uniref:YfhO family protein n=1 Tax=Lysinibacillus sp. KU-BSD001 TaxID=3141328 RepID=UPI0036E66834
MLSKIQTRFLNENSREYTVPLSIVVAISIILYFKFVSLAKVYIYNDTGSDTFDSYWPFIVNLHETIRSGNLPFWSHNTGIGASQYATNIFIGDPFIYFYLLFPVHVLPYLFGLMAIMKINVAAFFFVKYVRYLNVKYFTVIISTLLYAFNGYIILWGQHYQFVNIIVFLPLLLLGFEKILKEDKKIIMSIAVALLAINSYYFLYQVSLFLIIYAFVRYFTLKRFNLKNLFFITLKSLLAYIIGIGLSAFYLIPTVSYVLSSPRISGNYIPSLFSLNSLEYYISLFFRFFSNNTLGIGNSFFGDINYYEAPILFSSILIIILFPIAFMNMTRREKIVNGIFIGMIFTFLLLPIFSTMFNAFSKIDYRWTYVVIFSNIYLIIFSLEKIENISRKKILASLIGLLITISTYIFVVNIGTEYFIWDEKNKIYLTITLLLTIVFGISYIVLLFGIYKKNSKIYKYLIVVVLMLEIIAHNYPTINNRLLLSPEDITLKQNYNDYTNEAVVYLNEIDSNFFRVEKDYFSRFLNDPMIQNYNGITGYNSLHQFSTLEFLKNLDVKLESLNLIYGVNNRTNLEALLGVKYLLSKSSDLNLFGYEKIKNIGDIFIYKNILYVPTVFTYESFIEEEQFLSFDTQSKDMMILNSVVLSDSSIQKIKDLNMNIVPKSSFIVDRSAETISLNYAALKGENVEFLGETSDDVIKFEALNEDPIITIPLNETQNGHFSLKITIDSPIVNEGQIFWRGIDEIFSEEKSSKFQLDKGENIYEIDLGSIENFSELRIDVSRVAQIYSIKQIILLKNDTNAVVGSINNLQELKVNIIHHGSNKIVGDAELDKDEILYFSIPFDKGWKLKVDGIEVTPLVANFGFMATPLEKGKHNFELSYTPPFLFEGLIISLISLFVMLLVATRKSKRRVR